MKNLIISGLISIFCSINVQSTTSMDYILDINKSFDIHQKSKSEERQIIFKSQIQGVKSYIENLGCEANLVFGVSNSENGIERFDNSWIFADIDHGKIDNRSLTLSFNEINELVEFSRQFSNSFCNIAFDAEVPTILKDFSVNHLKTIHDALKIGGLFHLPWQYVMEPDYKDPNKWSEKSPEDAVDTFLVEKDMLNQQKMLDPILRLPNVLGSGRNHELNQRIIAKILEKNHLPVLEAVFGKGKVKVLEDKKLPFRENEGRLTSTPHVTVFLGNKKFPKKNDIPVIKPLFDQIRCMKNSLTSKSSYSLVVLVDETEQLERFDNSWIRIIKPCHPTTDSLALQTSLEDILDLKIIAKDFSNTFEHVVFDVETPSLFINDWTNKHFKYLFKLIKPGGTLTLPLHYEWTTNQDETHPTLKKAEVNIREQISSHGGMFIFKNLIAPYTFRVQKGKNQEVEDIYTRLQTFAVSGNNTERSNFQEVKLFEGGIERINQSFRIVGSDAFLIAPTKKQVADYWFLRQVGFPLETVQKYFLLHFQKNNPRLVKIIDNQLYEFTHGRGVESMKNAIEQSYLELERDGFIKKMNTQVLVPHTISFFENIFGKDSCTISYDKRLPFQVVRERQHMDYVVFKIKKP